MPRCVPRYSGAIVKVGSNRYPGVGWRKNRLCTFVGTVVFFFHVPIASALNEKGRKILHTLLFPSCGSCFF